MARRQAAILSTSESATSTAAQKEELSAHIGGVAGKNDSEGEISRVQRAFALQPFYYA